MKGKIFKIIVLTWYIVITIIAIKGVDFMAHSKTYVVCENMCMEEGMTKEEILEKVNLKFDKSNIAVLSGTVEVPAADATGVSQKLLLENYPTGFNKNNTVVIAQLITDGTSVDSDYSANKILFKNTSYYTNWVRTNPTVELADLANGVKIYFYNFDSEAVTYKYKIVLMKI